MAQIAEALPLALDRRPVKHDSPLRFTGRELSGGLGDLGTFLPLSVAMALTCGLNLGLVFIFAGLMNVLSGWWFRQPIPVQPMKAIATVAVAEKLTAGQITASGLTMGFLMVALAMTGLVDRAQRLIPRAVVRGIQAGIGIKLAWTGLQWLGPLPLIGWDSVVVAVVVTIGVVLLHHRQPALLYVFAVGCVLLYLKSPGAYDGLCFVLPTFTLAWPKPDDWWMGLSRAALPQLPLTLLNSVIAVCALSEDYFPRRGIAPRTMAASVGLMNLLCVPFGGMPMCHGAGGLAAQYRFGARTGGSVIMLGAAKILAGLFMGGSLLAALQAYPKSILAVMVVAAGLTLAAAARHIRGLAAVIALTTATAILATNTLLGFAVGCGLALGKQILERALTGATPAPHTQRTASDCASGQCAM